MMALSERREAGGVGEVDLRAVRRSIWARKWWVIIPTLLAAIIAATGVNLVAPRYNSEARILYGGREYVFLRPQAEWPVAERMITDPKAIASQVQLILSRELALQVIDQLKLGQLSEFDPLIKGLTPLKQALVWLGIARNPEHMTLEERVLDSYYDRISAFTIEKSRVITVGFQSADPVLAAKIVNTIAADYLRLQQRASQEQMRAASQWRSSKISALRQQVADAEAKVEAFRAENTSLSARQLGEVNSQLTTNKNDVQLWALEREARARRERLVSYLAKSRETPAGENLASAPPDARIISRGIVSNTPSYPKQIPIVLIATLATLVLSLALVANSGVMRANPGATAVGDPSYEVPSHPPHAIAMRRLTSHRTTNEDLSPLIAPRPAPLVATDAEAPTQIPGPHARAEAKSIADLVDKMGDGGTGHSVIFFRLAADARTALAPLSSARLLARDRLVVLVNLVEDLPDLPGVMSDRHALGLTDLVAGKVSFGDVIGRDRLSRAHIIPHGGAGVDMVTVIGSKRFLTMVNALRRTYDHVIIDAGLIADAPVEKMSTFASRAVLVTAGTEAVEVIPAQDCLMSAGYAELVVLVDAPQASRKPRAA